MDKADEIAVKVCYWNTNHYDDRAYFKENFQPRVSAVFANRTKIMGLARSYKNWPGKTRLVVPFVLIKESVPEAVEPVQPPAEAEASGMPAWGIVLIALLLVIVLIVVIILIRRHNAVKENDRDGTPE